MRASRQSIALFSLVTVAGFVASSAGSVPVTVHVPGYVYAPFVSTSLTSASDLELDAAGNVYLCKPGDIRRFTPDGVESPWSQAPASDIVFGPGGGAYGAGPSCQCLLTLSSSGSATTLHSDALHWQWVTFNGATGVLYATSGGSAQGLYTVDPTSGTPTVVIDGGPGPGGNGVYQGLLVASDGKLYADGTSDGSLAGWGVYRLTGGQFLQVGPLPNGGFTLAQDNQGLFYTITTVFPPVGPGHHEVWQTDPATGSSILLAEGPNFGDCVAYDRQRNRLYVADNQGTVYYIEKGPTPTRRETWSAVKARFH